MKINLESFFPFLSRRKKAICVAAAFVGLTGLNMAQEEPRIVARPLSPQEIKDYGLPADIQKSPGLFTVGVGQPVYLEAQADVETSFDGVVWTLTRKPTVSNVDLTESPLGENVPVFGRADQMRYQLLSRKYLLPDTVGSYRVTATIFNQANEPAYVLTQDITAALFVGVGAIGESEVPQCAICHEEQALGWSETAHATALTRKLDGIGVTHFAEHCVSCHSTGFDEAELAMNGGFDDIAAHVGWTHPEELKPGNWDAMPDALKAVSNVQCETCHGPGSEHKGNRFAISVSLSSGDCGQCHDSAPYHNINTEWNASRHAISTRTPTGESRQACVRCHSGVAFIDFADGKPQSEFRTDYEPIVCATCHDPHSNENPHQLRKIDEVILMSGESVDGGGKGRLCMNCHISRVDADSYVQSYHSRFGPHYGPQTDMLAGRNAAEFGLNIPSSAHLHAVADSCVTCHLQEVDSSSPAYLKAGGHTFSVNYDGGTPADHADDVNMVNACVSCHGPMESFNIARIDYDDDGIVEGVQTEVEGLLHNLAMLLPPLNEPSVTVAEDYTPNQLSAAFNYLFVEEDGSLGIHNTSYAVGLLKASIRAVSGIGPDPNDVDQDGLPDDWEIQHFGGINVYDGDDDPDNDGLLNSFEVLAKTSPILADTDGDGYNDMAELHSGHDALNAGDNPDSGFSTIVPAGEMVFYPEAGKTYQVQAISDLGNGEWENVGEPIVGSGDEMQRFISFRGEDRKFYRVIQVE